MAAVARALRHDHPDALAPVAGLLGVDELVVVLKQRDDDSLARGYAGGGDYREVFPEVFPEASVENEAEVTGQEKTRRFQRDFPNGRTWD